MTSNQRLFVLLALLGPFSGESAAGQQLETRPVPSRGVESFTFESPSMGVRFAVNVGLPGGFDPAGDERYPALIVTDGDWAFPGVHYPAANLMEEGAIESLFVISVGTDLADGQVEWVRRRVYEFSPPGWDLADPFGEVVKEACDEFEAGPGRCTGGAGPFLEVIASELLPMVSERYPVDLDRLGLFGVSAGGFFASWALFQPNSPFTKYIISSPAMAYGDGEIFRLEERYASGHEDLPVSVYFGAGGLEIQDGFLEGVGQIVSGMTRLGGLLAGREYPGLEMVSEVHPGMGHTDVMGTVVARGLRVLYGR